MLNFFDVQEVFKDTPDQLLSIGIYACETETGQLPNLSRTAIMGLLESLNRKILQEGDNRIQGESLSSSQASTPSDRYFYVLRLCESIGGGDDSADFASGSGLPPSFEGLVLKLLEDKFQPVLWDISSQKLSLDGVDLPFRKLLLGNNTVALQHEILWIIIQYAQPTESSAAVVVAATFNVRNSGSESRSSTQMIQQLLASTKGDDSGISTTSESEFKEQQPTNKTAGPRYPSTSLPSRHSNKNKMPVRRHTEGSNYEYRTGTPWYPNGPRKSTEAAHIPRNA